MGGGDNNPNSTSTIMASSNAPSSGGINNLGSNTSSLVTTTAPSSTPSPSGGINNLGSNTSSLVTTTAPPTPIFTFQPTPRVSTTTFNIPAFGEYRSSFAFGGSPPAAPFNDSQTAPFTFTHPFPSSGFGPSFSTSNPPPNSTFTNPFTTQPAAATNSFSIPPPTFTFPTTTSSVPTFDFSSIPKPMESEDKAHQTPPLSQHTFSFGGGLTSMEPPTPTIHVCKKCGEKSFWGQQWGSRVAPYTPILCCDSNPPGLLISLSAMTCYKYKSHEELKWEDYQLQDKPQGHVALPPTNEFATFGGVKPLFALPVPVVILPVMPSFSSGAFNIIP